MKTTAVIQARMSSTRLPGKVLLPLSGKAVLEHIVERLSFSRMIDEIIVSTTTDDIDDSIVKFCDDHGIKSFRGSKNDVLDRFYQTMNHYELKNIVRITADCPLTDPTILDAVILGYFAENYDYYGLAGSFPDGLDCTVISYKALKHAWVNASLKSEREHVGPFIEKNPEIFKLGEFHLFKNLGDERWTLDEESDYEFLKNIFDSLYSEERIFTTDEVLSFLNKNPEIRNINKDIIRNEGYLKSLKEDEI